MFFLNLIRLFRAASRTGLRAASTTAALTVRHRRCTLPGEIQPPVFTAASFSSFPSLLDANEELVVASSYGHVIRLSNLAIAELQNAASIHDTALLRKLSTAIGKTVFRVSDLFSTTVCDAAVLWRPGGSLIAVAGSGNCAVALWELPSSATTPAPPTTGTKAGAASAATAAVSGGMRLLVKLPPAAVGGGVRRVALETMVTSAGADGDIGNTDGDSSLLLVLGNDGIVRVWAVVKGEASGKPDATFLHGSWDVGGVVDIALCPASSRASGGPDLCVWFSAVVEKGAPERGDLSIAVVKVALRKAPGRSVSWFCCVRGGAHWVHRGAA